MNGDSGLKKSLRLSADGSIVLHNAPTACGSFQISKLGSDLNPVLSSSEVIRLAVEVIRNELTEQLVAFTAVRQLRFKSSEKLKRAKASRLRQIEAHFGGALRPELRQQLLVRRELTIDNQLRLRQSEDHNWMLQFVQQDSTEKPLVSWRQLTTLAVLILRDAWTEIYFRSFYLPQLRTPEECEAWSSTKLQAESAVAPTRSERALADHQAEVSVSETDEPDLVVLREKLVEDQRYLDEFFCELDRKERELAAREQVLDSQQLELRRREGILESREAKCAAELARISQPPPPDVPQPHSAERANGQTRGGSRKRGKRRRKRGR